MSFETIKIKYNDRISTFLHGMENSVIFKGIKESHIFDSIEICDNSGNNRIIETMHIFPYGEIGNKFNLFDVITFSSDSRLLQIHKMKKNKYVVIGIITNPIIKELRTQCEEYIKLEIGYIIIQEELYKTFCYNNMFYSTFKSFLTQKGFMSEAMFKSWFGHLIDLLNYYVNSNIKIPKGTKKKQINQSYKNSTIDELYKSLSKFKTVNYHMPFFINEGNNLFVALMVRGSELVHTRSLLLEKVK